MAANSTLLDVNMPYFLLEEEIKRRLREELEQSAEKMKANVAQGTSPPTPGHWIGKIQANIQVEDLGGGFGGITFGVGLQTGTPEQALWMAYIYNFGSGQFGKNGLITSKDFFYNVDTGSHQAGRGNGLIEYPQFAKNPNHWFDDVAETDLTVGALTIMMQRIVEEAVDYLFASGKWKLKGHRLSFSI